MNRINLFSIVGFPIVISNMEEYWTDTKSHAIKNKKRVIHVEQVYKLFKKTTRQLSPESYTTKEEAELAIQRALGRYTDYELGLMAFNCGDSLEESETEDFKNGYNQAIDYYLSQTNKQYHRNIEKKESNEIEIDNQVG